MTRADGIGMIIKDEIHGTLEFDELEERIIDSPPFQRLRRIKQMSVTSLVYPGANHTRFEHSIGTAYLASVIAERLGLDADTARRVKLCGLLHDIGHTAFSHEGEDVLERYLGDHESLGRKKVLSGAIADIISENYRPKDIAELEKSNYGSIVTSDLGADRMDYLKRDALNTGVAYGIIDIDRIVHTLMMEKGELCISKGGLEAAENLLLARFMMFSAVYMHRTVRIATAMLYRAIEGSIADRTLKPEQFAELGDESALSLMAGSEKGGPWAEALLARKLYKEVCSFSGAGWTGTSAKSLEKKLTAEFQREIIVDYPHQFFKPVAFRVKTDEGIRPITELSTLVQSLRKSEEERRRVLVLADAQTRENKADEIKRKISGARQR
jgi:putative nucleotidyltransferase with HDIG domain